MHKIKQLPEDFIVKEINEIKLGDNGDYSYFLLKKKNYNTLRAIESIVNKLNINEKNIGFSGNKDKNAITEQVISIHKGSKKIENIAIKDIELKYLGNGNEKIYLGNLKGNKFEITIRNLTKKDIGKISNKEILMPNYFGPQRFSKNNHQIGKAIVKKNFKKAINLILETNSDYNEKIKQHLQKKPNDFVVALKMIPFKLLKLYVHAYQSYLFNKALEQYIRDNKLKINDKKNNYNTKLPIVGFGTEIKNNNIDKIIKKILKKENIGFRDFIIRQIPELSSEGDERNTFITVKDFKIINQDKDELNNIKEKLIVSFSLPKGCYATVFIDYLFT
ncbi:hypothetical protein CMO93_02825 [Candidatus Woesearchaeota archaeon]|jgi:tRNA pseudouridine13 synthase|nr:hypothetical protein [Candidatus Woesearchaeota archaeon]|tara:strand:+ start:209 stop:1207 length:999 start_codon:yes stop_codon:yes gene_type:complete